jgi:D-hexose-6-phosphate mutarotase
MEVEIQNGMTRAIIDSHGAWLTNLSDDDGDIFFPRRKLTTTDGLVKERGGCHVCVPNFGPGGTSEQPQHGFARVMDWEMTDKTESSVLFALKEGEGEYRDMTSIVAYQLGENRLVMTLELTNNGLADLRAAPAFHPYFALRDEEEIKIDEVSERLNDLNEVQFFKGNEHMIQTQGRHFAVVSDELTTWAKWTDRLGRYVCVEPSLGGFTFLNEVPSQDEILAPNESKTYTVSITWG